jgi:hypothetical protein
MMSTHTNAVTLVVEALALINLHFCLYMLMCEDRKTNFCAHHNLGLRAFLTDSLNLEPLKRI